MDPTTIDSRKNADPYTSTLHFLIYEGLTRIDPTGKGTLALAKSVDISADQKRYTFHLRPAQWSDGHPLTAHDFEYSWRTTLSPDCASPCPYLLYPIKNAELIAQGKASIEELGVKALDDQTLQVDLENPTPYFLSLITFCNLFPIPKHIEEANPDWELSHRHAVFSGPYRIVSWKPGQKIELEKNPSYWNAKQVHIPKIHAYLIPDAQTSIRMYEQGELDFVDTVTSALSLEDLSSCKAKGLVEVNPVGAALFCTFNTTKAPFHNKHIRRALSLAINRPSIVSNILQLSEKAATSILPPVLNQNLERTLFPAYAPEEAQKELKIGLKETGFSKEDLSKALVLTYQGDEGEKKVAQTIQHQWKQVLGLQPTLMALDKKTLIRRHMDKDYAVGLDRFFGQYFDPYNILERFKYKEGPKNLPGFEHPDYIALLDESLKTIEPKERLEILRRAEEILADEMPIAPLYFLNQGYLINRKDFDHIAFSPLGNLLMKDMSPRK
jgi:oligopeptide transport system substrate-binding protein